MMAVEKQIWTRVSAEVHERLKQEAKRNSLALSGEVRFLVEKGLGVYKEPTLPEPPSQESGTRSKR